jgi:hypothetical protein
MSSVTLPQIPLGAVVAERHFILWDSEGTKHEIVVKLGAPVLTDTVIGLLFQCPAQILGLGVDQTVYARAGEDAFVALCYALDIIGQELESKSKSLNLQNRYKRVKREALLGCGNTSTNPANRLKIAPTTSGRSLSINHQRVRYSAGAFPPGISYHMACSRQVSPCRGRRISLRPRQTNDKAARRAVRKDRGHPRCAGTRGGPG